MRIPFRQGLVRVPATFLQVAAGKVSLVLSTNESVVATFADGAANYLTTERLPIPNAWTGPFVSGTDYWLFIDINTITGQRTFGHTVYSPVVGDAAPTTPLIDQHWFDTATNTMKVWSGNNWMRRVRVFAAKLQQGSVLVSMSVNSPVYTGTQTGSTSAQPISSGALVFDGTGAPLKKADGTFFTTEDTALTGIASSTQVKFGSIVVEAEAVSSLPAYSIVRFVDFNRVDAALNFLVDNGAYGIIETDATTGDVVNVTMEGLITNPAWDWSAAGVNAQLFVSGNGTLTTVAPPSPIPVAAIIDKNTILLRPSTLFMNTANDQASIHSAGAVMLSIPAADPNEPIAVGTNDPRISAVLPHISDFSAHLTAEQNTFIDTLTASAAGIVARKSDGTGTTVSVTSGTDGIVVTNGNGNAGNPTLSLSNDLAAVEGLAATGLTARTANDTWATRQIVAGVDSSGLTITNGDGVAGNPTVSVSGNIKSVQDIVTPGITSRSGSGTWGTVSITTNDAPGLTITNGDGVAGNPTISFGGDLSSLTHQSGTGIAARTAAGSWTTRSLVSSNGGLTITNGDGVAGNPTIEVSGEVAAAGNITHTGVVIRTGSNNWDATTIAGVAGDVVVLNPGGFDGSSVAPITIGLDAVGTAVTDGFKRITTDSKGRIVATAPVSNANITASLGYTPLDVAGSNAMTVPLNMASNAIHNVATPVNGSDAANKSYVDSVASGLDPKQSVRAATTNEVTMFAPQTVDGISLAAGDRVLVKDQSDATTNGIYVVVDDGVWTRTTDTIPGTTLNAGGFVFVESGTINAKTGWVMSAVNPVIAGTTAITWQQFSGAGEITAGPGLTINGNTMSVAPSTAGTLAISNSSVDLAVIPTVTSGAVYKSVMVDAYGRIISGSNPSTLGGYGITDAQPLNANLTTLAGVGTTGLVARTGTNTFATRTITGTADQISVSAGDGIASNPVISINSDPVLPGVGAVTVPAGTTAQAAGATQGQLRYDTTTATVCMSESGAWRNVGTLRSVSVVPPADGVTVVETNPTTDSVVFTVGLSGELAGVQAMSSNGIAARTTTGTWTTRTIQGTSGRVVITNGTGIAGDPTIDLAASGVAAGSYRSVAVDSFGRVINGTNPTTIAGYGLTDAQPLNTNLTNLSAYATNGFVVQNASGSFVGRSVEIAADSNTNLTISNPDGTSGNPVIGLTGDLLAVSQLSATGFAVRTGAQTWAQRQITGAVNRISVTNPTGTSTDPMIDISASYVGQSSISTVGTINAGIWHGTTIAPQYGGTGLSSLGGGNTLFGINAAGSGGEYKTVNGTSNQITITHGVGTIIVSTPQDINTTSDVQFRKTTVAQSATTVQALVDDVTVAVDLNLGTHVTLLATSGIAATRQLGNPTNMVAGTMMIVKFTQDTTGGRNLTFGTAYRFAGGSAPVFSGQSPNVTNILTFWCDGTSAYEVSRSLAIV